MSLLHWVRYALSTPLLLLQVVTVLLIGGFRRISQGAFWVSHVVLTRRVYWGVVIAKRWVEGAPRWQVHDLLAMGRQPVTAADRAVADADDRLAFVRCDCGDLDCPNRDGSYVRKQWLDEDEQRIPTVTPL